MRRIIRNVAEALACALLLSCGTPVKDPAAAALEADMIEKGGEGSRFQLYTFEKIDSTSLRREFEKRSNMFQLKIDREYDLYLKYSSEGKRKNAALHNDAMMTAIKNLRSLDSLRSSLSDRLDDIAFYEYVFSGKLISPRSVTEFRDFHMTISPSWEIIGISENAAQVRKASGRAIPGYMDIFFDDFEL